MKRIFVRSKIHRATVTDGNINYQGSITVGRNLLEASGILPFEFVHVNNINNANHWETYVIPGNDGEIILNGASARLFQKGDLVVIMALVELDNLEIHEFKQKVVFVDENNVVTGTELKKFSDYWK